MFWARGAGKRGRSSKEDTRDNAGEILVRYWRNTGEILQQFRNTGNTGEILWSSVQLLTLAAPGRDIILYWRSTGEIILVRYRRDTEEMLWSSVQPWSSVQLLTLHWWHQAERYWKDTGEILGRYWRYNNNFIIIN